MLSGERWLQKQKRPRGGREMRLRQKIRRLNDRGHCRDPHRDWIASVPGQGVIRHFAGVAPARVAASSWARGRNAGRYGLARRSWARACNEEHCKSAQQQEVGSRPVGAVLCSWTHSAASHDGSLRAQPSEFQAVHRAPAWTRADCKSNLARPRPLGLAVARRQALTRSG